MHLRRSLLDLRRSLLHPLRRSLFHGPVRGRLLHGLGLLAWDHPVLLLLLLLLLFLDIGRPLTWRTRGPRGDGLGSAGGHTPAFPSGGGHSPRSGPGGSRCGSLR